MYLCILKIGPLCFYPQNKILSQRIDIPDSAHRRFYKMQCNARNAESELNFYAKSNLSKIPGDNFLLSNLKISNKI